EFLCALIRGALRARGLDEHAVTLLTGTDRDGLRLLLSLRDHIDLVIPRGGASLIQFVAEHSSIPTIQHFHGVCHLYVDAAADLDKAVKIASTGKTSAPATCNSLEAVLVHADVAAAFVPRLCEVLASESVEIRGDDRVCSLWADSVAADSSDWGREFLDYILAMRVVSGMDEAIDHIERYGSGHTEAIVTDDASSARAFTSRVQSSCVLVNASTRFNDGFQLGLGAEIGISTSKIHAYGPMGLEELTTQRFVVYGDGHFR
ncbi:MAG: glutamate-5-semialdehyde dehydrogenase, partial [Phycisphaerae bacterium]